MTNVELDREALVENPEMFARKNGLGIPKSTSLHMVVEINLRILIIIVEQFFVSKINQNGFSEKNIIGDEVAFHMNANVSTHHICSYAEKGNPLISTTILPIPEKK